MLAILTDAFLLSLAITLSPERCLQRSSGGLTGGSQAHYKSFMLRRRAG
jgi:hypothetical protein